MSKREFTLASLVPDPITITIGDHKLAGRSADTFGVEDAVRLEWLQREFKEVEGKLNSAEEIGKEQQIALARTAEHLLDDMIRIIVPDITNEQLRTQIKFGRKLQLIQWWQKLMEDETQGGAKPGRGKKAQPTPARPLRGSSTSTA